jgi:hypothetical protein
MLHEPFASLSSSLQSGFAALSGCRSTEEGEQ